MIERYSDHAANERTYLAWVRTAISVMAFGFLVERFDIFLQTVAFTMAGQGTRAPNHIVGDIAGLFLIMLGAAMMVVATIRFRQIGQDIDAEETRQVRGTRSDVALIGLLLALGVALFGYLTYMVGRSGFG